MCEAIKVVSYFFLNKIRVKRSAQICKNILEILKDRVYERCPPHLSGSVMFGRGY